jgi:hypothetical protein
MSPPIGYASEDDRQLALAMRRFDQHLIECARACDPNEILRRKGLPPLPIYAGPPIRWEA